MRCCLVRITDMVFAPHLMMAFRPHLTPMVFGPPRYCHGLSSPPEQIVPVVEEFVSGLGCVYSPAVCQAITPPSKLALCPDGTFSPHTHSLFMPHENPRLHPTVLFYHGNAGNVGSSHRFYHMFFKHQLIGYQCYFGVHALHFSTPHFNLYLSTTLQYTPYTHLAVSSTILPEQIVADTADLIAFLY